MALGLAMALAMAMAMAPTVGLDAAGVNEPSSDR